MSFPLVPVSPIPKHPQGSHEYIIIDQKVSRFPQGQEMQGEIPARGCFLYFLQRGEKITLEDPNIGSIDFLTGDKASQSSLVTFDGRIGAARLPK